MNKQIEKKIAKESKCRWREEGGREGEGEREREREEEMLRQGEKEWENQGFEEMKQMCPNPHDRWHHTMDEDTHSSCFRNQPRSPESGGEREKKRPCFHLAL